MLVGGNKPLGGIVEERASLLVPCCQEKGTDCLMLSIEMKLT